MAEAGSEILRWGLLKFEVGTDKFITRKAPQQLENIAIPSAQGRTLLTVFVAGAHDVVDSEYLERLIQQYLKEDDVFRKEFLVNAVFLRSNENRIKVEELSDTLERWGCQNLVQMECPKGDCPKGPYLFQSGILYQTWKIYNDVNHAFISATWPSENDLGSFEIPFACGHAYGGVGVPVPSRLYDSKSDLRPLAGDRIAIKDIFHLKGIKTSLCSRDYFELYSKQESTADSVQILINAGAHIIGKTHLSSFAMWEEPTQCTDFQDPFNPRGDGYQSPAGSSSGSGAAIASYDWLDYCLGTDTTGSGRRPALWNGSFALRPTALSVSAGGMIATSKEFDIPSVFSRDISSLQSLARVWLKSSATLTGPRFEKHLPWKIIYPTDYFPVANPGQDQAIRDFVSLLAKRCGEAEHVSISERWANNAPVDENNMDAYMENVQVQGFWYEAFHLLDQFRADHQKRTGRPPYFSEVNRWIWGIAANLTESSYRDAMDRFHIFKAWFLSEILQIEKRNAIMILPVETLSPRYRDVPPERKSDPPRSINELWLSPIAGCPELIIPIGQVSYHSRISQRKEYLPVAVGLLGNPGSEKELMALVESCLAAGKRPLAVAVGKEMGPDFLRY